MMMAPSVVAQELGPRILCCTWQSLATAGLCNDSAQTELNKNNVTHFRSKNTSDIQAKIKYMATINFRKQLNLFPLPDILKLSV